MVGTGLWLSNSGFMASSWAETADNAVELIDCGDRALQVKISCNPRWPTERKDTQLKMVISASGNDNVTVTISKWEEPALRFEDLNPAALQRVYAYADAFKYAKTRVNRRQAIRVEGHPQAALNTVLLDYFLLNNSYLYRISYAASSYPAYRKYLPVFVQMMRQFDFLTSQ